MVSIIVPVYNAEKTIERCVKSILKQSVVDKEIILVNDGSKDKSLDIINELASTDNNIRVIDKPNGGVSSARNIGLINSRGKYITFIDSDDYYLDDNYIANMINQINANQMLDLVVAGYTIFGLGVDRKCSTKRVDITVTELARDYLSYVGCGLLNQVWNKLFRRELIDNFFDERMTMGEDAVFVTNYLKNCRNIAFVQGEGYCYIFENNSTTTQYRMDVIFDAEQTKIYHAAIHDFWRAKLSEEETAIRYIRLSTNSVYQGMVRLWVKKGKIRYWKEDITVIISDSILPNYSKYLSDITDYNEVKLTKLILTHKSILIKLYCVVYRLFSKLKLNHIDK